MDFGCLRSDYGFKESHPFNLASKEAVLAYLPPLKGVYVITSKSKFGRFEGESDIVYIGKSELQKGGLRKRVRYFFHPGKTQLTSKRICELLKKRSDLMVSYVKREKAKELEKKLLEKHFADHLDLPPLNRQG